MSETRLRHQTGPEHRWNLDSLFESEQDWRREVKAVTERVKEFQANGEIITRDAQTLLSSLQTRDNLVRRASNISAYARMRVDTDREDKRRKENAETAKQLFAVVLETVDEVEAAIRELNWDDVDEMMADVPQLRTYEHYLKTTLSKRDRTYPRETEDVIDEMTEVIGGSVNIYEKILAKDFLPVSIELADGEVVTVSLNDFVKLQRSEERERREFVHREFFDRIADYQYAITATYRDSLQTKAKMASLRNYETVHEAEFDKRNITKEAFDQLVTVVRDNVNELQEHVEWKKQYFDVETINAWDLYAPAPTSSSLRISFDKAKDRILESTEPLGDEYQSRLIDGFNSNWIDLYPGKNKRAGSYVRGTYDSHPYVLLNYRGDIHSTYELTHELGHAMHHVFTSERQPFVYSETHPVIAETASLMHDTLLMLHALEDVDETDDFRRLAIGRFLERARTTLYRQTLLSEFEFWAHERVERRGDVTLEELNERYQELKTTYYGSEKIGTQTRTEWMRCRYLFRSFYMCQAPLGLGAAVTLAEQIRHGDDKAIEAYLELLSSGSQDYPLNLLRSANIDLESPEPLRQAVRLYRRGIEAL